MADANYPPSTMFPNQVDDHMEEETYGNDYESSQESSLFDDDCHNEDMIASNDSDIDVLMNLDEEEEEDQDDEDDENDGDHYDSDEENENPEYNAKEDNEVISNSNESASSEPLRPAQRLVSLLTATGRVSEWNSGLPQSRRSIDPIEYELAQDIEEKDPEENALDYENENNLNDHSHQGNNDHTDGGYISSAHECHASSQFPLPEAISRNRMASSTAHGEANNSAENLNEAYDPTGSSTAPDLATMATRTWLSISRPLSTTYQSPYASPPVGWTVPSRSNPTPSRPFTIYQDPPWYEPEPPVENPYWDTLASDDKENIPHDFTSAELLGRNSPFVEDNTVAEAENIVALAREQ
ncbi:hypothetical protein PRK78_003191 [Emydomyces testavorans]|uniref:Uncharacterized protein n=1 Tax=Emydomyces testavorans TaxID=2070801 RepID=A0AAF0DGG2_9EURO|nr:hypothetical protein PRK78_003191 [Emydomyces testavorans]